MSGDPVPFTKGSGRLELAEAIADPKNPLTARVMVNRIWQTSLWRGPGCNGQQLRSLGERPSHPELLDYLAARFVEQGWSIKAMHREIVLSATYALSAESSEKNSLADPDNQLLWRANRRKLDAEALRDSLLFVSGKLDLTMGGEPMRLSDEKNLAPHGLWLCKPRQTGWHFVVVRFSRSELHQRGKDWDGYSLTETLFPQQRVCHQSSQGIGFPA